MKCKRCGFPQVEGILWEDGVCGACLNFANRERTNWEAREKELEEILDRHRGRKPYDCAIAVSGGKDSHFLVHELSGKWGMNPLLITVMDRFTHTIAGVHNFSNLCNKYNNWMYTINMDTFVKSTRWAFEQLGQPLKYTEYAIYTVPYEFCKRFDIPLLFFGENSAYEYGKTDQEQYVANGQIYNLLKQMDSESNWWANGGVSDEEMYRIKTNMFPFVVNDKNASLAIYMSYFYPWSSEEHLKVAKTMGFRTLEGEWEREGCCENYEQMDSYGYIAHLWFRYPRLGYQRTTDIATRRVREGIWTKERAEKEIKEKDGKLDTLAAEDFREVLGYTYAQFWNVIEEAGWNKYNKLEQIL